MTFISELGILHQFILETLNPPRYKNLELLACPKLAKIDGTEIKGYTITECNRMNCF